MRPGRHISLLTLLAGAILALVSIACTGSDSNTQEQAAPPAATETATATPSPSATPTQTPEPTPTPSPTPFAGAISRLSIPRFNVSAPIEELAINELNELDTPKDENRAVGWYYIYDRPGWGGNAVFSAHVYYGGIPGPFVNLAKAVKDDIITVTMEDGTEYRYKVISNTRYHRDTIPMGDIIWPGQRPKNSEWITLITCGGQLDATGQQYLSRDVIVAEQTR